MTKTKIKLLIEKIKCIKNGHQLNDAVSCPFTGRMYKDCYRCGELVTL